MSGKVRYIFTMRTPLIDNLNQVDEEKNEYDLDDCGNKISENSGNSSFAYGAKEIPDKYKFPESENAINLNMNCNYIQNQIKHINYKQKMILNSEPILIQDTADASNMDKGLKFRHNIYLQNKKKLKKFRKYPFEENFFENPFNNNYNNNIQYDNDYRYILDLEKNNDIMNYNNYYQNRQLSDGALINENEIYNYNNIINNNAKSQNQNTERFKNIGNLIVSQDNKFNSYKKLNNNENIEENNNDFVQYQEEEYKNNRYGSYNSLKNSTNNQNNNNHELGKNKFIFFNKDEYNKLYNSGKGLTKQINQNLNLNENNNNNNEIDEKYNYQLSTIKNENVNNSNNTDLIEEEKKNYIGQILEDSLNLINNSQNNEFFSNNKSNIDDNQNNNGDKRPFSPPITKIENADELEI